MDVISIIMAAGKSSVDVALYTLLPIMVIMLIIMKYLEVRGILDVIVRWVAPLLKPFGLTGMSAFALIQINFVSFAAPLATLSIMDKRGVSDRQMAATLAMVFAMSQANAALPMMSMGLNFSLVLAWSVIGGLCAAAATWYGFGRQLSAVEGTVDETLHHPVAETAKGVLDVINRAGAEAFKLAVGAIPMLVLSLVAVTALKKFGLIDALTVGLTPFLAALGIDPVLILPALTKYLAGGTAMMGVMDDMRRASLVSLELLNQSAGFLISPFDLPGVAILISAGPRLARVWKVAALGACLGIAVRTAGHILCA